MRQHVSALLLTILLAGACSASDNLNDSVKQQYKKHVLGLRTPFQKGDQEFDSTGKPLKDPDGQRWRRQGAIVIDDVNLDEKILRIKGRQVAYTPGEVKKKNNRKEPEAEFVPKGQTINVVVHLDHLLTSAEEAKSILGSIFFLDSQREHLMPQFQRVSPPMPTQVLKVKEDNLVPPQVIYSPDPDYSREARNNKYQATVELSIVVDTKGKVAWLQLARAAGMGLDEEAVEAVKTWKFKPAHSHSGEAAAVKVNVEVSFNLN